MDSLNVSAKLCNNRISYSPSSGETTENILSVSSQEEYYTYTFKTLHQVRNEVIFQAFSLTEVET